MKKLIIFICTTLFLKVNYGQSFELNFYNKNGVSKTTINIKSIDKIEWEKQKYFFKDSNCIKELKKINLYNGTLQFVYNRKVLSSIQVIDLLSSNALPNTTSFILSKAGHILISENFIEVLNPTYLKDTLTQNSLISFLKLENKLN